MLLCAAPHQSGLCPASFPQGKPLLLNLSVSRDDFGGYGNVSPAGRRCGFHRPLEAAAAGDLSIVLYNPASQGRPEHLRRACGILLRRLPPERPCGVARSIGRDGESGMVLTLEELADYPADMFCTVFIGNSTTRVIGGRLVTPRGYRHG